MQPNFPVNMQAALEKILDANRALASLVSGGEGTIFASSRGDFEPFRTHRLSMLVNNTVYTPYRIGPHKSILYRGIEAVSASGVITPQSYTANDVAYYLAGRKDADASRWMALQVGKSMEFDSPVDEGWIWIPNAERNPTFAIFDTSVVGYIRAYDQAIGLDAVSTQDGTSIEPNAAVTVTNAAIEIVPAGTTRTVTLYNQGAVDVWLGGTMGGPNEAVALSGVPLKAGALMQIKNSSQISGVTASGSADVSFSVEE